MTRDKIYVRYGNDGGVKLFDLKDDAVTKTTVDGFSFDLFRAVRGCPPNALDILRELSHVARP
ncbi:hypothetical protein FACS1894204_09340 [Synergistales bacterium]|nr:hypothetical protein FACS1894204_09340 [Synergistales bacterium]